MPPRLEMEKVPPCMSAAWSLPVAGARRPARPPRGRAPGTPFWSAFRITGTTRPPARVGGEAEVVVALQDQLVPLERGVDLGEAAQRGHAGLHQEGEQGHLGALLGRLLVELDPEGLQVGDVGLVVLGDVRDHHPVAGQVGARELLDAGERAAPPPGRSGRSRPWARGAGRAPPPRAAPRPGEGLLHEALHVGLEDAAVRPAPLHPAPAPPPARGPCGAPRGRRGSPWPPLPPRPVWPVRRPVPGRGQGRDGHRRGRDGRCRGCGCGRCGCGGCWGRARGRCGHAVGGLQHRHQRALARRGRRP